MKRPMDELLVRNLFEWLELHKVSDSAYFDKFLYNGLVHQNVHMVPDEGVMRYGFTLFNINIVLKQHEILWNDTKDPAE